MSLPKILLSVCIPVRDDLANLRLCLSGLKDQDLSDCEIIVCDDGSQVPILEELAETDISLTLIRQQGQGPSVARNHMAEIARGQYLFFVDADTVPRSDMIQGARDIVLRRPEIDAFYGSYDDEPGEQGFISWYRNLLHHHTHQTSARRGETVTTFWCGWGVIRRELYLEVGGLSVFYDKPSIEDIELGSRLTARGIRIEVYPDLQVKHLKRWTLRSWLQTDLLRRGIPWVRLMRTRNSWESQLNFSWSQRFASVAAVTLASSAPLLLVMPRVALALGGISFFVFLIPNRRFVSLARQKRGVLAALFTIPLHLTYALVCVTSVCIAFLSPRLRLPATPRLHPRSGT